MTKRRPARVAPPKARRQTRKAPSRRKGTTEAGRPPQVPAISGLAPGMQAVNTYLAVANVAASVDFLERAFGFDRGVTLANPDGQLRYAEMRHGDSVIMLIRKGDTPTATDGVGGLYTYVPDVDRALMQAREAGAGVNEAEDRPWGDRTATVTDPDGYRWVLATFKKLVPFS